MDVESIRLHCLRRAGTTEGFPFDGDTLVFKVMGKMFCLLPLDDPVSINLKCEPERAVQLREEYPEVIRPGWHMNKTHWNTVSLIDGLPSNFIKELIDHSYDRVVMTLKKSVRAELEAMEDV